MVSSTDLEVYTHTKFFMSFRTIPVFLSISFVIFTQWIIYRINLYLIWIV